MQWMRRSKAMKMKLKRKKNFLRFFRIDILLFSEQLVDQVLSELNINIGNQIPSKSLDFEVEKK